MPINLPDWSHYKTGDYKGYGNILEDALKGYEMARKPKQIAQEEQYRDLVNKLRHEQGKKAELTNQYLPHKLENEAKTSDINLQYLPKEKSAGLAATLLSNENSSMKNEIQRKFGVSGAEAELLFKQAQAQHQQALTAQAQAQTGAINNEKNRPGLKYGNQAAKLWEAAQVYRNQGDERSAKHYEDLASQELANSLAKANKAGKAAKTPEELKQEALARGMGTQQAKQYAEAEETLQKASTLKDTADSLKKMTEDPLFAAAVGPVDNWMTSLVGFGETREFARELDTTIGRAQFDLLGSLKGSTSDKELKKIEDITASRGNTESALRGYVNSLHNISEVGYKRSKLIAEQVGLGIPRHEALEAAQKAYPIPDRNKLKKAKGAKSGIDKNGKHHDNIHPSNVEAFKAARGTIDE